MYQGMQTPQYNGGYYQQSANPNQQYGTQYQRYVPTETPMAYPSTGSYLKGRPVVSIEEARAASIDLDGSLHIFTDIGNKKIYTKQINLDGTATLNVYTLQEEVNTEPIEFVTKAEFTQEINKMQSILNMLIPKEEKKVALDNF